MRRYFDLELTVPMTLRVGVDEEYINQFRDKKTDDEEQVTLKALSALLDDIGYDAVLYDGNDFSDENGEAEVIDLVFPAVIESWQENTEEDDD